MDVVVGAGLVGAGLGVKAAAVMRTSSTAMSLNQLPVVPVKRTRVAAKSFTRTLACCQESPWSPDFDQRGVQVPVEKESKVSVPMLAPSML